MSNRLGIYAEKFEAIREQLGLTPAGFRQDGEDAAGPEKEAALAELYRRADSHMSGFASALGPYLFQKPKGDRMKIKHLMG